MREWMRRLVTPPQFPGDEESTRLASAVQVMVALAVVLLPVHLLVVLPRVLNAATAESSYPDRLGGALWWLLSGAIASALLQRRMVRAAGGVMLAMTWVWVVQFSLQGGGIMSWTLLATVVFLLAAGLLFGYRAVVWAGAVISASLVLLCVLTWAGMAGAVREHSSPVAALAVHLVIMAVATPVVWYMLRGMALATERMRESEQRMREMFSRAMVGIFRTRMGGEFVEANPALLELLAAGSVAELNETGLMSIYTNPESRKQLLALLEEGPVRGYETQFRRLDGRVVEVAISAVLSRDAEGKPVYLEGTTEDITQRKEAARALVDSQERMAQIIEFLPDATMARDVEGRITAWNRAMVEMTGIPAEEMIGRGNYEYAVPFYGEQRPVLLDLVMLSDEEIEKNYSHLVRRGNVMSGRGRITHIGKSILYFVGTASALRNSAGEVVGAIELVRDVTESHKAEMALRESEERLRTITEAAKDAIIIINGKGQVTYWNPAAEATLGYTTAEAAGKSFHDLIAPERYHEALRSGFAEFQRTGDEAAIGKVIELEARRKDGTEIPVEISLASFEQGGEHCAVGIMRDVTARREAEHELQRAKEAAEAANRAKSAFLANMSHEIRTPMNAILGYAQLMERQEGLTAPLRDSLETIERSGEHLLALINDILEMSKIEAGRTTLSPTSFDFHALLGDMERMFRVRTEPRGLSLQVEHAESVPRFLEADEGKVRQVLINMLGNAVKFTDRGGVALRAAAAEEEDGIRVAVEVEDTGCGIAAEDVGSVFEAFEQTESGRRTAGGTGLGMPISRQFARMMGGDLTLRSEPGKGSTFRYEFLARVAEGTADATATPPRHVARIKASGREWRVLVVDDSEANRDLLRKMLTSLGFSVREAMDGAEALEVFAEWRPDAILMDRRMPVMDGLEATRRIKATPEGAGTPILVVTASAMEENRAEVLEAGADAYLRKPFRLEEILALLQQFIGVEYEEESGGEDAVGGEGLNRTHVQRLAPKVRAALRRAVEQGDMEAMEGPLAEVAEADAGLAKGLRGLAEDFDYAALLRLLADEEESDD